MNCRIFIWIEGENTGCGSDISKRSVESENGVGQLSDSKTGENIRVFCYANLLCVPNCLHSVACGLGSISIVACVSDRF